VALRPNPSIERTCHGRLRLRRHGDYLFMYLSRNPITFSGFVAVLESPRRVFDPDQVPFPCFPTGRKSSGRPHNWLTQTLSPQYDGQFKSRRQFRCSIAGSLTSVSRLHRSVAGTTRREDQAGEYSRGENCRIPSARLVLTGGSGRILSVIQFRGGRIQPWEHGSPFPQFGDS
jgi:hypothetical protein